MLKRVSALFFLVMMASSWGSWHIVGHVKYGTNEQGEPQPKIVSTLPKQYQIDPQYTLKTQKGYLIQTIKDYAAKHNWQLLWLAKRDFPLNLATQFEGPDMQTVLSRLLQHYPLSMHMDQNLHMIVVGKPKLTSKS